MRLFEKVAEAIVALVLTISAFMILYKGMYLYELLEMKINTAVMSRHEIIFASYNGPDKLYTTDEQLVSTILFVPEFNIEIDGVYIDIDSCISMGSEEKLSFINCELYEKQYELNDEGNVICIKYRGVEK